jgi:hypothetical protein
MTRARAAALLLALAGASGCCRCAPARTLTVRNGPARAPPPGPALGPATLRAFHLGDFGDATCQQAAVAAALHAAHLRTPFDLGLAVGDLVYDCGPDQNRPGAAACAFASDANTVAPGFVPPDDPAFAVHDRPLRFLGATPVYAVLGNHDVGFGRRCGLGRDPAAAARAKACLNVAHRARQWDMPGRHYAVDAGPARFIVIDSNLVVGDYGGFTLEEEVAFVASQVERCETRTCFLVGHHPPVTAGAHRREATPEYLSRMARLLGAGQGRIRAYLAGHDHDLQHLRSSDGLDVLVSGAGARGRWRGMLEPPSAPGAQLLFGSLRWGFGVLEVSSAGWRYRFEDAQGQPLHCCAAVGAGSCEPASCAE